MITEARGIIAARENHGRSNPLPVPLADHEADTNRKSPPAPEGTVRKLWHSPGNAGTLAQSVGFSAPAVACATDLHMILAALHHSMYNRTQSGQAMESESSFTWVHISDLHFTSGNDRTRFERDEILEQMRADAEVVKEKLGRPDAVFVTGDVAYSGKSVEYDAAQIWLGRFKLALGVSEPDIFIVPGNHDVDRKLREGLSSRLVVNAIRAEPTKIDEALGDEPTRATLVEPQQAFTDFRQTYAAIGKQPFWSHSLDTRLGKIRVIGLNSALASLNDQDSNVSLVLGKTQLGTVLENTTKDELHFVLSHHPWSWLYDGDYLKQRFLQRPHIFVSGHLHNPRVRAEAGPTRELHRFCEAGAGFDSYAGQYAYAWHRISQRGHEYFPRVWDQKRSGFTADRNGHDLDGEERETTSPDRLAAPVAKWLALAPKAATSDKREQNTPVVTRISLGPILGPHYDPNASLVLKEMMVSVDRLFERFQGSLRRGYENFDVTYHIRANGDGEELREFTVRNHSEVPISILQHAISLEPNEDGSQPISFLDLGVSLRCGPSPNQALVLPMSDEPLHKVYGIAFFPAILRGDYRTIRLWTRIPQAFRNLLMKREDRVVFSIRHETIIDSASLTVEHDQDWDLMVDESSRSQGDLKSGTPSGIKRSPRRVTFDFSQVSQSPLRFEATIRRP